MLADSPRAPSEASTTPTPKLDGMRLATVVVDSTNSMSKLPTKLCILRQEWFTKKKTWQHAFNLSASLKPCGVEPVAASASMPLVEAGAVPGTGLKWGLGCLFCNRLPERLLNHRTEMAPFRCLSLRRDLLLRHQRTAQHVVAASWMGGLQTTALGKPLPQRAPGLQEMKDLLRQMQLGDSSRRSAGGKCSDRMINMRWCLMESLAEQDRTFLRKAKCITLIRDERHGRLLVRFVAGDGRLNVREGTMGVMTGYGSATGASLVNAMSTVLQQCCTERLGLPRQMQEILPSPHVDEALLEQVRGAVELLVSDSASNELLAASIARGWRAKGHDAPLLPHVRTVFRDLSHATRRIMTKPWQVDERIDECFRRTIWSKQSPTQLIWNSKVFSAWFKKHIETEQLSQCKQANNLRAAKHRFESTSWPLGRVLLHLQAFVKTVQHIAHVRTSSSEGTCASSWLRSIDSERLLLLAMVADAHDEASLVVRAFDEEMFDLARTSATLDGFARRVSFLFHEKERGCFSVEGYTAHCMMALQAGVVEILPHGKNGEVRVLRPPRPEAVERCLERMRAWVRLALSVMEAECPSFCILHSFSVFDLREGRGDVVASGWRPDAKHVERLAQSFHVDAQALSAQLQEHRPYAQAIKINNNCGCREAWREAVLRRRVPSDSLQAVLLRYLVWTASSSGVEQRFSMVDRLNVVERSPQPSGGIHAHPHGL